MRARPISPHCQPDVVTHTGKLKTYLIDSHVDWTRLQSLSNLEAPMVEAIGDDMPVLVGA